MAKGSSLSHLQNLPTGLLLGGVGFSVSVVALGLYWFYNLVIRYSHGKVNLKRYRHPHAGFFPVPGKGIQFQHQGTWRNRSGVVLRTYCCMPRPRIGNGSIDPYKPRAVVIFNCAVGSHMNRVAHFADRISEFGYATFGIDYQGFGDSQGTRGLITSYESLVRDIIEFRESLSDKIERNTPVFIGGESFGADLAICCSLKRPDLFQGMLLLAPVIKSSKSLGCTKSCLARCMPRCRVSRLVPADATCKNLGVSLDASLDPLCITGKELAGTEAELLRLSKFVLANVSRVTTPFIVQHGLRDMVADLYGTKQLLTKSTGVRVSAKHYAIYPTAWHDLLHEFEHEDVIQQCLDWMDEKLRLRDLAATLD